MRHLCVGLLASGVASTVALSCLSDEVDQAEPGVFACEDVEDCGEDEFCVLDRCEIAEPPTVVVRNPEPFEVVANPNNTGASIPLPISVGGSNLKLTDAISSGVGKAGEGYVDVLVDGEFVTEVTSGSLAAGVTVMSEFVPTPGPHRISLQARRADGVAYDNPEASAVQLVWVDDGKPHVGIVSPLPGAVFPLGETDIEVRVATLNFSLVPAAATRDEDHGHAHIHYEDPFPSCVDDPTCDCCYVAIASPNSSDIPPQGFLTEWVEPLVLPGSSAGGGMLTAVLRRTTHTSFTDADGNIVFDTVMVQRVEQQDPG